MTQEELAGTLPLLQNRSRRPVQGGIENPGISCTPGVCGGSPCIVGTRIPVWVLQRARLAGASDDALLEAYPSITNADLKNTWLYVQSHECEVQLAIRENDAW